MPDPALITGRLNVPDYVEARKSDIKKLEELVLKTGSNSKKRAFQSLPRVERRRAASHDPKRVPRKRGLRKRAILEDIREAAKKQKIRKRIIKESKPRDNSKIDICTKNRKVDRADLAVLNLKYEKRQRDKIWLPTHIWHRKRAFMTLISGIMIPQSATQKQYRKTYRLSTHIDETGAMAWDTSYLATIVLRHENLAELLKPLVPDSLAPLYQSGERVWQGQFPNEGPVVVHWFAKSTAAAIQCHPTLFDTIWDKFAATGADLEDCRFAIGSIDLLGPNSLKIINGLSKHSKLEYPNRALIPYRAVVNKFFSDPRAGLHGQPDAKELQDSDSCVYTKEQRVASLNSLWSQSAVDQANAQQKPYSIDKNIPVTLFALDDGRLRLLLPRNWILTFWLMIHKGKHVSIGGQQELHQIAFEHGNPFFPNDFVHTPAGQRYNELKAEEARNEHSKKPASKRPDLSENEGDPFKIADFELLPRDSEFIHIRLEAVERGVPKPGARIYKVNPDQPDTHGRVPSDTKGQLLGFVTSGDFALSEAKGAGIGLITGVQESNLCLVRNVGSQSLFLSKMKSINL